MTTTRHSFYTVPEIAADWHVSEPHVWRLIREEKISATRFGGATRISTEEKNRYERACTKR